ncbi:FHA domain-containing protein [Sandaracinus amylolyticus]|uniref:FHA domain-containing protein n=1 Tax=Sandaracinus amylolyticus TaxID=927083 RepID=UPI001F1C65C4|nr:FHA domain-containing protein [Sandaracinus amylolyticus]UJR78503.1 FHA domain-containing protein [Sandaracinus amylolyticus]
MSEARGSVVVVGRAADCDVRLDEPTVSSRHARLHWDGAHVLVEDLESQNGTWVAGQRISRAKVRPGDEVVLGGAALPWSHPALATLLRRGRTDTITATLTGRLYECGRCGTRGFLPRTIRRAEIQCSACGATLELGQAKKQTSLGLRVLNASLVTAIVGIVIGVVLFGRERIAGAVRQVGKDSGVADMVAPEDDETYEAPVGSPQEAAVRAGPRDNIIAAIDPTDATTRNFAARVAARSQGPFNVGQVAAIWSDVRARWSYVNDPRGSEYFARASETITNEMVGDCDDFAILLTSTVEAIGGDARVVMSDGDRGGHAYAEVCIPGEPEQVVRDLQAHYRRERSRTRVRRVHYRSDATCAVWLNLDWSAEVPGGPYGREVWAVAIHPDGKTETLAPAAGETE